MTLCFSFTNSALVKSINTFCPQHNVHDCNIPKPDLHIIFQQEQDPFKPDQVEAYIKEHPECWVWIWNKSSLISVYAQDIVNKVLSL